MEPFVVGALGFLALDFTGILLIVFLHYFILESVGTLATAIASEVGAQNVSGPCGVSLGVDVNSNLSCVADSTVANDDVDGAVLEPTSASDTEGEDSDDDMSGLGEDDVIPSDIGTPDPPILQGRLVRLTDYLPHNEMPDISFTNPANFWFVSD